VERAWRERIHRVTLQQFDSKSVQAASCSPWCPERAGLALTLAHPAAAQGIVVLGTADAEEIAAAMDGFTKAAQVGAPTPARR
jgi:hypothetical protein